MLKRLMRLSLISLVTLSLQSCQAPPPAQANLCTSVHPIHLQPEEVTAITTAHLAELVAQNRKIAAACP